MTKAAAAPAIILTNLPPYGSSADVGGLVLGVASDAYRVAVFIYVPGYGWVSKPTCAQPLSVIQSNGSWTADITTGGSDTNATRIAALLVSTNYNLPCVDGAAFLPTNVFAQAVTSAVVTRTNPGARFLSFSGYDWWVKTSSEPVGPGTNYFSNSTNNVWVDGQGWLHLRITHRSGLWQCAEIISARTFGYGSYRFELASPVNDLDPNAVLGLFTWSDDPAYADREIDLECSRWGNPADPNNSQYVVQPYYLTNHLLRYAVPAGLTNSALVFAWQSNQVSFQSQRGSFSPNPAQPNLITNWTYTLAAPQTGDENVRLNLWLNNTNGPASSNEVEVVIKSFQFVPLGAPPPARLHNLNRLPNGQAHFNFDAQPDWRYLVQASTNLGDWLDLGTVLATSPMVDFLDSNSAGCSQRYFRAITLQ
ncbi:MAG: hypothetical protein DME25_07995 [Verrucomicrobia bacterium]|nr:MAG: hypothetical protein DME25_07995 [Verrucomicrobiota bacterium]